MHSHLRRASSKEPHRAKPPPFWRHDTPKSGTAISDVPATLDMKYDKQIADFGTFYKSDDWVKVASLGDNNDNTGNIGGARAFVEENTFTESIFQLISGTFSGVVSSSDRNCEDIIVAYSGYIDKIYNNEKMQAGSIKAFCPVLDNDGNFKEFKEVRIDNNNDIYKDVIGLAAGDFVGVKVPIYNASFVDAPSLNFSKS